MKKTISPGSVIANSMNGNAVDFHALLGPDQDVLGSANLNDVSEALSLHFTSDDYDTIGGYCLGLLDHLPEKNEIILTDNNILLRIDRMEKNRIERIYIRLPEPLEETGSEQKSEE